MGGSRFEEPLGRHGPCKGHRGLHCGTLPTVITMNLPGISKGSLVWARIRSSRLSEVWAPGLKVVWNFVAMCAFQDSELEAHVRGPYRILINGLVDPYVKGCDHGSYQI